MTLRQDALSLRRAATAAGAAYLVTMAAAVFAELFARSTLTVRGDAARTVHIRELDTPIA